MSRIALAKEIIKLAKEVKQYLPTNESGEDEFVYSRKLKLEPDAGYTRGSLNNAQAIKNIGYKLYNFTFEYDKNKADFKLTAWFKKPFDEAKPFHIFGGFSFGYNGEGPRGLISFCEMFDVTIDPDKVTMPPSGIPERGKFTAQQFLQLFR